jgi:phage terminase large subunit-like protein
MNRIDALIRNPDIYYDDEAVEGWIDFCESELTLTDGSDLYLLDTFKLWGEQIFGWYYFIERSVFEPYPDGRGGHYVLKQVKTRLINKQYLIIGRGAAKTLYESCIHGYYLVADTSTTKQVTTAPTIRQAEEVMSSLKTAIARAKGPVFSFLTEGSLQNTTGSRANRPKLAPTKDGIKNFITNSLLEMVPMDIDKLQGSRCKIATIDEWLSGDIREDPITAIEQGCAKGGIDDYVIIAMSSEGTVRNGSGDSIKMQLMKILRGEFDDDESAEMFDDTSIWYYKLDDIHEVADPRFWIKANPNLGRTVTYTAYEKDVAKAENFPDQRNEILAKRFNLPMEGYTYFFTYEETKVHGRRNFWKMPCSMGADLSQGDDFCAFTFLFPLRDGSFGVKVRSYITSKTLAELPLAMHSKYQDFIREGSLIVLEGVALDMMQIYEDLDQFIIDNDYDVRCFGFDPYNAKEFVTRWETENGPFGIEKVIQGAKTESVPLGELKHYANERMLIFDQELMSFCMGNCITLEDTNGNRKLYKKRREQKIDNVSALMDAYIAWKANKDAFE